MNPTQLKEKFPWMSVDDITVGAFGDEYEGWLDPYSLLKAFRNKAKVIIIFYL
jgi:FAD-dependent oxidoreductase domain-containing protein 1